MPKGEEYLSGLDLQRIEISYLHAVQFELSYVPSRTTMSLLFGIRKL